MKLRHPRLIALVAFVATMLIRVWTCTLRLRTQSRQPHPVDPTQQRLIYAFWHDSLLAPATFVRTNVRVLISHHADGELIARVCHYLGHGVVRGSTTRGGTAALMRLIRSESGHLAITPDGPRGPRRRVQIGIIQLASTTGLPIVPVGVGYSRAWHARSWDRFSIPQPLSTVTGVILDPIFVPSNLNREQLEQFREDVEAVLLAASELAEDWATGRGNEPSVSSLAVGSGDSILNQKLHQPIVRAPKLLEECVRNPIGSHEHDATRNCRKLA